jgi:hypothetical protein
VDAAFTNLPITVGRNVHLIDGKQTSTNTEDPKILVFKSSHGRPLK